mmetsp:Transcript_35162/g.75017  ORF Transcript_35162/g.75017 Transcript_35162/m.75017 type:complete len:290 (+) Transcript_35162:143-1012(+)
MIRAGSFLASATRAPKSNGASAVRRRFATHDPSSSQRPRLPACGTRPASLFETRATLARRRPATAPRHPTAARTMASSGGGSSSGRKESASEGGGADGAAGDPASSQELALTPGEKVVAGTRLLFWAGALSFASVCAYYIGKELLPTKMSPNAVFDRASAEIRGSEEVRRRFGDGFKTYGRDHGGHREGRRNFVEHTEYVDQEDGSKRTRVRFNLEGPYGAAFVFAEVSKDMPSGEFVYILVQDKRNGAVITVRDNRSALLAKRMAGGSAEGQNVFSNLLGGGGGGSKN